MACSADVCDKGTGKSGSSIRYSRIAVGQECRSARRASRALKYTGAGSGVGAGSNLDGRREIHTAFRGGLHGGGVTSPDEVEKAAQAQVQYDQRNA